MIDRLAKTRLLVVLGSSGSGKSSLVNCGLRPSLHRGAMATAGSAWRVAHFRPGNQPLVAMARALAEPGVLFEAKASADNPTDLVATGILSLSQLGLIDLFEQARLPEHVKLLVVVDQFEELFRYRTAAGNAQEVARITQEAKALVSLLLRASELRGRIYVVLTMRSDFLGECAAFPGLPEAVNRSQYLVPRMTRHEREAAICHPARLGGSNVSPVLLTRLLNELESDPDQLSILQHALNRTWVEWRRRGARGELEIGHYQSVGGMAGALDQHAESAYASLRSPERLPTQHGRQQQPLSSPEQLLAQRVFRALTDRVSDSRGIRRPTTFGALVEITGATPSELRKVLEVFRHPDCSFLTPPSPLELLDSTVLDLSHESLMRVWKRLGRWIDEEVAAAELYKRLNADAARHAQQTMGFWGEPELSLALKWRNELHPNETWAERYASGFNATMVFLDESEQAERWRKWRFILLLIAAGVLLLGALVGYMQWQRKLQTVSADAALRVAKADASARLAIASASARVLELRTQTLENERDRLREQKALTERELQNLQEQNPFLRADVHALRTRNQELRWSILKLRDENRTLPEQIKAKTRESSELAFTAKDLTAENAGLTKRREALTSKLATLDKQKLDLGSANSRLEEQLKGLRAANEQLRDELLQNGYVLLPPGEVTVTERYPQSGSSGVDKSGNTSAWAGDDELQALTKQVAQLRALLGANQDEHRTLTMLATALREDNERLERELAEVTKQNDELQRKLRELEATLAQQRTTIERLQKEQRILQAEVGGLLETLGQRHLEISSLKAEEARLTSEIGALVHENRTLQDALTSVRRRLRSAPSSGGAASGGNGGHTDDSGAAGGPIQNGDSLNASGGSPL